MNIKFSIVTGGGLIVSKRKTPLRKCVVTQEQRPKKEMIRIVRNNENEVFMDTTGKKNGRGAYLTIDTDIINRAEKEQVLDKTFKVTVDPSIYEELRELAKKKDNG